MLFGIAKDIITPTFPMPLSCPYGKMEDFKYIHDDVFVRCLVMDDGKNKTVLMAFDLLFHDRCLNFELEAYAKEKYGVKESAFIVGATHDHVSPASKGYSQIYARDEYEVFLLDRAKSCLDRAMCSMFEGTLEHTSFDAFFNMSRRGYRNGVFGSFASPDSPRDTEFSLLVVKDLSENIRSVVMNYACHPVFYPSPNSVSGEFPARVCQLVDANFYGCVSLYLQSAGGDVRPAATVVDGDFAKPFGFDTNDGFARSIADEVVARAKEPHKKEDLLISSDCFCKEFPMDPQSFEFFVAKVEDAKQYGEGNIISVNAEYIVNEGGYEKLEKSVPLYCQTIKLSDDLYIAAMGGEPTYRVKQIVTSCFGEKQVFFVGYTDSSTYIVSDFQLDEGGYEARDCHLEYRLIGPFKKGIDQKLVQGFTTSFKKLNDEKGE